MPILPSLLTSDERRRRMRSLLDQVIASLRRAENYNTRLHQYATAQLYVEAIQGVEELYKYCYIDPDKPGPL